MYSVCVCVCVRARVCYIDAEAAVQVLFHAYVV